MRLLLIATLLTSAAAIGFEILLMRVLSIVQWHHFAYMVLSLALLGYGASGTWIALRRDKLEHQFSVAWSISALLFSISMVASFVVGQRIPFNALEIVWNPAQLGWLSAMYLVFFLPFFFAAVCIGLAFTFRRSQIERIYFFDLAGAACGAVAIVGSLYLFTPQAALQLLAAVALLAALAVGLVSRFRHLLLAAQAVWALLLFAALPGDWLNLRLSPYKGLSQAMQVVDTHVVAGASSPVGMLTVLENPTVPFREAPGLSFNSSSIPPEQLAMFTDGDGMSPITRWDGSNESLDYLTNLTAAAPYQLLESPRVLVLGAGGGSDVLLALRHGARAVDAVDLNPQAIALVRDTFGDYAGHVYRHEAVTLHAAEARGFVSRGPANYDLIHIALLDSFSASGSGVQALSENYLYTVEALQQYLRHLEPDGVLALTRWLKLPPRDSLKLVATAIVALQDEGIAEPGRHIAVLRSWNTATVLVRRSEFTASETALVRRFAESRSFDMSWYPGMPASDANRFNLLSTPWLYDGIAALTGPAPDAYVDDYKFNIVPATDDKPYYFHFFRWRALPEMFRLRGAGGGGLIEWGYLIVIATLAQAIVAGAVLILLPLALSSRHRLRDVQDNNRLYFFLIGLAFMFVEIAFIQKLILILSHPLYAVAVVLSGFLLFAGLGSAACMRIKSVLDRASMPVVRGAVIAISVLALLYAVTLPVVTPLIVAQADSVRVAVSLSLIAPLAFCMGVPFPIGLKLLASRAPEMIPWAWGINGFASVVSASLATLLAIEFGFTAVLIAALALYVAAALRIDRQLRDYGDSI